VRFSSRLFLVSPFLGLGRGGESCVLNSDRDGRGDVASVAFAVPTTPQFALMCFAITASCHSIHCGAEERLFPCQFPSVVDH